MRDVIGDITHPEGRFAQHGNIDQTRIDADLTFIAFEFLYAHGGFGDNGKNEFRQFDILRFPILWISRIAYGSSFTYFSKIKGPVPTGLRFMSEGAPDLSNCAAYSAERIDAGGAARFDRKTALGDLSVKRTIYGLNRSGSSIFSTS